MLICRTSNIRSATEMSATSAVPLRISITRFPQGGSMMTNAWGRMTRHMRLRSVMLSATAASHWPFGTARIAPRTSSAP